MEQLYERVCEACKAQGISIKQLEKTAGVGNGTIGKGKHRGNAPRLTTLQKISEVLDTGIDTLLGK